MIGEWIKNCVEQNVTTDGHITVILGILTIYGIFVAFLQFITTNSLKKSKYYMGKEFQETYLRSKRCIKMAKSAMLPLIFIALVVAHIMSVFGKASFARVVGENVWICLQWFVVMYFIFLLFACIKAITDLCKNEENDKYNIESKLWTQVERCESRKINLEICKKRIKKVFTGKYENNVVVFMEALCRILEKGTSEVYLERELKFIYNILRKYRKELGKYDDWGLRRALEKSNDLSEKCILLKETNEQRRIVNEVNSISRSIYKEYMVCTKMEKYGIFNLDETSYLGFNQSKWGKADSIEMRKTILCDVKMDYDMLTEYYKNSGNYEQNSRNNMLNYYVNEIFNMFKNKTHDFEIWTLLNIIDVKNAATHALYENMLRYVNSSNSNSRGFEILVEGLETKECVYFLLYIFYKSHRCNSDFQTHLNIDLFREMILSGNGVKSFLEDSSWVEKMLENTGISYYVNAEEVINLVNNLLQPLSAKKLLEYGRGNITASIFLVLKSIFTLHDLSQNDLDLSGEAYVHLRSEIVTCFINNPQLFEDNSIKRIWEQLRYATYSKMEKIDNCLKFHYRAMILVHPEIHTIISDGVMEELVIPEPIIKYLIVSYGPELKSLLSEEYYKRFQREVCNFFSRKQSIQSEVQEMIHYYEQFSITEYHIRNEAVICSWISGIFNNSL